MTTIKNHLPIAALFIIWLSLFAIAPTAQAVVPQPDFVFTVNGGSSAVILNGQDVTLGWYVNVPGVSTCTINNGVGPIDVSTLPASGSMTVTPPDDTSTNYAMNCDGEVSTVTVDITPTVTMTLPQGDNRVNSAVTQRLERTDVAWDSQSATRCGNVWREEASNPGVKIWASHSREYRNRHQPSGWVRYRGWPHGYIDETSTFYIECFNDENGSSAIGEVTLTVIDPPPPPLPVVNMWTPDADGVYQRNDLYGYADVDVRFNSTGVTGCSYQAFYQDGITPYPSLPRGYGQWGGHTGGSFRDVKIATTTIFQVTCSRGSLTYASTTYPATSTSDRLRIEVATGTEITLDRTELPAVTASVNALPNPAEKHPITNSALIQSSTTAANADYCYRYAYRSEDGGLTYTDRYRVGGWTKDRSWDRASGNANENQAFYLDRTTRLEIYCLREYDVDFGTASETENGTERVSVLVEVEPPSEPLPPPVAYMYGEAVSYSGERIWNEREDADGFYRNGNRIETPAGEADDVEDENRIEFVFDHPRDGSDIYNVHFRHCDESDGISYFRFFHEDTEIGNWTTDREQVSSISCDSGADFTATIAKGIEIAEGDEIRIECRTTAGERCRLLNLYFGVGSGDGDTLAPPVSSSTGLVETKLMWMSDYATWCDSTPDDNMAVTDGGNVYRWYFGNSVRGTMDRSISTSTTFHMECYRYDPDFSIPRDESSVRIALPVSLSLTSSTSVATGDCIDPDTLQPIDTPEGFQANPSTGLCEPAVDLEAANPAVSFASAVTDNVAGTYDNVEALVAINNLGPGALAADSGISYMANMTFAPVYGLPVLDTAVGTFDGAMLAPANASSPTVSPTLTRTFNDVPFGSHQVCARVNLDDPTGDNYPESNLDPSNNSTCGNVSLPVPPPPMTFTANPDVLRRGETAELFFEVDVTYQMSCTLRGAGGIDETFDTLVGPNPTAEASGANNMASLGNLLAQAPLNSGTITTEPLTSTSKFIFQCNEPITNTTFTEEVTVEVLPITQEF